MFKIVSMWSLPAGMSGQEFEHWYATKHVVDAQRIPGLKRYTINRVVPDENGSSRYYRIAELGFESREAARAAFASPEWKYAYADAKPYIGDFIRLFCDSTDIIR